VTGVHALVVQGGEKPHETTSDDRQVRIGMESGALPDTQHGGPVRRGRPATPLAKDVLFCGVIA
jgi:hypothetical protein